jgi:MHS family proline/betaine transporter-like MFS transporter
MSTKRTPLLRIALFTSGLILLLAQALMAIFVGCVTGVYFVILTDMLKMHWQGFGMAMAYTLPMSLFGGTAPAVDSYLIERTGQLAAPAVYIVLMGLIALPVMRRLAMRDRTNPRTATSAC